MFKWKSFSLIFVLVLALALVLLTVVTVRVPQPAPLVSLASYQDADAPLVTPAGQEIDPRFQKFSAFDRAILAPAAKWQSPIAPGALFTVTKPFLAPDSATGHLHLGVDLQPFATNETVYAVANGLVVFSAKNDAQWGNVVVIAHRDAQGALCQSIYAQLDQSRLNRGAQVVRGQVVGTIGGMFPAFHFAIRTGDGAAPGPEFAASAGAYLDPLATVAAPRDATVHPEVLGLMRSADSQLGDQFSSFEITGAERLAEILAAPNPPPAEK
jgi:murein DD-endopeptidase MepM/ murein hydrolase activator NlpD